VYVTPAEEKKAVSVRARRLAALAAHPNTNTEVGRRIRAALRRSRLNKLASHPGTHPMVAGRIAQALKNDAGRRAA
jgi:hypothetical protein